MSHTGIEPLADPRGSRNQGAFGSTPFLEPSFLTTPSQEGLCFHGDSSCQLQLGVSAPGSASVKMICPRLAHHHLLSISLLFQLSLRPSRKTKFQMEIQKVPLLSRSGKWSSPETLRSSWFASNIPFIFCGVPLCHSEACGQAAGLQLNHESGNVSLPGCSARLLRLVSSQPHPTGNVSCILGWSARLWNHSQFG